jgi:methylglutaconyl-CoA hydratase
MLSTLEAQRDSRGVLTVAFNRAEVRNAFNEAMIEELTRVFEGEARAPETRAVVLKGHGPVFSAGADQNWMRKSVEMSYEENLKDTRRLAHMFAAINECPRPVIGLVQGAAIGGGVGFVSVCDIVIAESGAQFSLSEVRLGIVPACIGPFVIAKIGASHARGLFVSAARFPAAHAQAIGLVHETVPGAGDLAAAGERTLANILQCGPNAMAVAKRLVLDLSIPERRAHHTDPLDYVARTLSDIRISPEGQEGVRAFLEKRRPAWLERNP